MEALVRAEKIDLYASVEGKYLGAQRSLILGWIFVYTHDRGYPPTIPEIASMAGYTVNNPVQSHLDELEEMGLIDRVFGNPRTIRVTCDLKLHWQYEGF